ncbi:helix-turn-helix transcriptional regulator [Burkholderia sp. S171]|uniref:helix-turn-helix domain-containing protein n=1 Tax=Burkholderia sp. S171 TaxID=1641860 RepID=UPI00131D5998|nr:helix-turn-helix transcriptional regulator [Burkholderia sp. S171]
MNLAELGGAFKRARIEANLTQGEVAQRSGVQRARISLFETGALAELGAVKMMSLFNAVGLETFVRPAGHRRTLDDVLSESADDRAPASRQRVRPGTGQRLMKTDAGKAS